MPRITQTVSDKNVLRIIGNNIKFYRINNNRLDENTDEYGKISQEKLAELAGVSASMISNVEARKVAQGMSIAFLTRVAEALEVPLYALFLKEPVKNPPENPFKSE